MPVVSPQVRPMSVAQTEEAWRSPRKTIVAPSTGMQLPTVEEVKPPSISSRSVDLQPADAANAKREQAFRLKEQAFKAERTKFEAEKAALVEKSKYADLETKLAAKDYSALDALGISYEDYTNYIINKGESVKPEVVALKKLESEIEGLKSEQIASRDKQYEATVNSYRNNIKSLVKKDPVAYEAVGKLKAEEHVLQHILDTFEKDDIELTVEEATKEVEEALIEEALVMTELKKLQEKRASEKKTLPPPKTGLRTLTHQIAPASEKTFKQSQFLTPAQRLAQAVAKANNQR